MEPKEIIKLKMNVSEITFKIYEDSYTMQHKHINESVGGGGYPKQEIGYLLSQGYDYVCDITIQDNIPDELQDETSTSGLYRRHL